MRTLIRDGVLINGYRVDVLLDAGVVARVGPPGSIPLRGLEVDEVVPAGGRALLPGLHDHHLHLLAMAAAAASVDCGPRAVADLLALGAALAAAPGRAEGWVRGFGYHETVAGDLDRRRLDEVMPDRPVRLQHRSGALWVLNSLALDRVGPLPDGPGVERDADGEPTGRLWRLDPWLASRLPRSEAPDLEAVGRALRAHGITGATDATPDLDPDAVGLLAAAVDRGALPGLMLLGSAPVPPGSGLRVGPLKLLLHDHDLPDFDSLASWVEEAHRSGRPVAVHVVTRTSLVLTLAVLDSVGTLDGDRIEHAAVVPPDLVPALARLGVRVVTQPGFLRDRGDDYLRDVDPDDQDHLYPHACLLDAGVPVAASSDAPYGPLNPWVVVAAAADRRSRSGRPVGADRPVGIRDALLGYLSAATSPGGPPRRIEPGVPADVIMLEVGWHALDGAGSEPVRRTWSSGNGLPA